MTTQQLILSILSGTAILLIIGSLLYLVFYLIQLQSKIIVSMSKRIGYLTDVVLKIDPQTAHVINQSPPTPQETGPKEGLIDFAGLEGLRVEEFQEK